MLWVSKFISVGVVNMDKKNVCFLEIYEIVKKKNIFIVLTCEVIIILNKVLCFMEVKKMLFGIYNLNINYIFWLLNVNFIIKMCFIYFFMIILMFILNVVFLY